PLIMAPAMARTFTDRIAARVTPLGRSAALAPGADLGTSSSPEAVDSDPAENQAQRHVEEPQPISEELAAPGVPTGASLALDSTWFSAFVASLAKPCVEPPRTSDELVRTHDPEPPAEPASEPTLTLDVAESLSIEPGRRATLPIKVVS